MTTLRQMLDGQSMYAYGTSEGAKRGWDSRGRRSEEKTTERNREIARFHPSQASIFGPQHVKELQEKHRERLKKLASGHVEDTLDEEETGMGGPGH